MNPQECARCSLFHEPPRNPAAASTGSPSPSWRSSFSPDWPRGDEITVHHLLTLSAGFPNINELPGYLLWSQSVQTPEELCAKYAEVY